MTTDAREHSLKETHEGLPPCMPASHRGLPADLDLKNSSKNEDAPRSCPLLLRLGIGNLVDEQAHATLRDDVRGTVADLDADHGLGSRDAQHREEVHDRICAPADHSHQLSCLDLVLHNTIGLTLSGLAQAHQQLLDDVQEEGHR